MGYDAGILVTEQIMDEHKWFVAMEEVRREFEGESYFKEMPENRCTLTEDHFKMLDLTEPLNFSGSGKFFFLEVEFAFKLFRSFNVEGC